MSRLYEDDFTAWAEETVLLLRKDRFGDIDMDALIEEIEGLARYHRDAIKSQLKRLLLHLLKLQYCGDIDYKRAHRGWYRRVAQARGEIEDKIEGSPSLSSYPASQLDSAYRKARGDAFRVEGLQAESVPESCPWRIEQVLDPDFFPSRENA
ncbi:DUF29 domain-containing protein [Candidatus Entotheonella palauensis]|uniref:DUF29 domain-containing protein n=1 Tax=Candidatus Entotheonella gemina TaxID=1429439 RepID=W4LIK7_9BACT|nr:DUF29 domain-containing protein [Candidatus Entotheonella palauensis]ETW97749.1 MAG: hypothetical protein ETSY2_44015 [Candidatus Entotheonella gemina]